MTTRRFLSSLACIGCALSLAACGSDDAGSGAASTGQGGGGASAPDAASSGPGGGAPGDASASAGGQAGAGTGGEAPSGGTTAAGGEGGAAGTGGAGGSDEFEPVTISFGTTLDPRTQVLEARALAESVADPSSPQWRAKGDQRRTYRFPEAGADVPYRVCVPNRWDGTSKLPLVMFLHGASNDESSYLDQNNKQMVNLADQHGVLLVSPLGYQGAYGNFLRLPAVFGQPEEAEKLLAMRTPERERDQELSEKDVINVLELVLHEYPIDRSSMFLTGHSMGSGGTWYIGAKYADYWKALAPMSGPFVQESGYPWDRLRNVPIFVTEGTRGTPSLTGSHALRDWMMAGGYTITYKEVDADHPGMVPLVLPDVFDFFDRQ
ncbi:hypothetical protein [Sorangium atrum]|uniref:Esterase n=1 Tax=Sorangium atrum TaxID=2995308 RepID=A0ABT5BRE9_9BACT|nr:hypothetical protein [Sorangium aterium]MDC0676741.1 hypothetical protein [Sorangium aterium]